MNSIYHIGTTIYATAADIATNGLQSVIAAVTRIYRAFVPSTEELPDAVDIEAAFPCEESLGG